MASSASAQPRAVDGGRNARHHRFNLGLGQFALGGLAAQVGANHAERTLQGAFVHIAQVNMVAGARKHVRDARPHGSRTHHADCARFRHTRTPRTAV